MSDGRLDPRVAMEGSLLFTFEQVAILWNNWATLREGWKDSIPFTLTELAAMKKINEGIGELNNVRGDGFDRFSAS